MKMILTALIVLAFSGIQPGFCNRGIINVDNLITKYTLGCGHNNICTYIATNPYYFMFLDRCPRCSCDDNCFELNNCCPDVFFTRKHKTFTNFVIGSARDHDAESYEKYEVIVNCPPDADAALKANCESSMPVKTMIKNPPVTSLTTNLSYSNSHCAKCNGEIQSNLVYWKMGMGKTDIPMQANFISPFSQLLNFGKLLEIPFLFTPPSIVQKHVKKKPDVYLLPSTCPDETDPDIKMACESSYFLPFRFYQNVFCYICNIQKPSKSDPIIKGCNVTGQWDDQNLSLQRACINKESSPMSFPYKNFYCFLCNTISTPSESEVIPSAVQLQANEIHFYDASFVYEEKHSFDWKKQEKLELKIKNIAFRGEMMYRVISNTKVENSEVQLQPEGMFLWKGKLIDVRRLVQKKIAMFPDRICNKMLLPTSVREVTTRNCECGIDCVFRNVCSCCVDTALMSSATCMSDSLQSAPFLYRSEAEIIVIDGCSQSEEYAFFHQYRKLCELDTGYYSSLFVTNGSATFKNVFCYFCNTDLYRLKNTLLHHPFSPLDLNIVCPRFFHFLFAGSIKDIIRFAKAEGCSIFFDTENAKTCRHKESDNFYGGFLGGPFLYDSIDTKDANEIIETCNSSGSIVNEIDEQVQWACENVSNQAFPPLPGYKNEFCLLCNGNNTVPLVNNTCPSTPVNSFLSAFSKGCEDLPDVTGFTEIYPYKNSFCYACNNVNCGQQCFPNSPYVVDAGDCSSDPGKSFKIFPSFVFPKFSPSIVFNRSPRDETESTMHGCYPGRVLVRDICELIITETDTVLYGFDISTILTVNSTHKNISITLQDIEDTLKANILKFIPVTPSRHYYFFLLPNRNWSLPAEGPIVNFKMQADLYFELQYTRFDRRFVETSLIHFPFSIDERYTVKTEQLEYDVQGLGYSTPKSSVDNADPNSRKTKFFKEKMFNYFSQPPGVLVLVNKLLFCVQRKINASLFFLDKENLAIVSNETLTKYAMGEFVLDFFGFIGVCDDSFRYRSFINLASSDYIDINYLSTVFNGVSSVCVASVFLSFFFFKSLRTPSGINSMATSLLLFGFHAVGTQVKLLEHKQLSCLLTGIGRHYFWLSISFSVSVTAAHHFTVLRKLKKEDKESSPVSRISLIQIVFCVLIPVIIVGLNTVLLHALSDKGLDFYHSNKCFLSHQLSYILTFLSPIALSALLTLSFNYLGLKEVANLKEKMMKKRKGEFFVSFKIAVMVCLFASLQISEWVVSTSTYSFVIELIVSTHGCFFFLAFCCSLQICRQNNSKGSLSDSGSNQSLDTEKVTASIETQ